MTTPLRIAALNCTGIVEDARRALLHDLIKKLETDLIFLQETHSRSVDEAKWEKEWSPINVIYNSTSEHQDRTNRVAIISKNPSLTFKNYQKDKDGGIIATTVFNDEKPLIHLISIYAPTTLYTKRTRNKFIESLYLYFNPSKPNIPAGDFNMVLDRQLDRQPSITGNECPKTFLELCETLNLRDTYRTLYGKTKIFTRRQGNTQSTLDRFCINQSVTPQRE